MPTAEHMLTAEQLATLPAVVAEHFAPWPVGEMPWINAVFVPGTGWVRAQADETIPFTTEAARIAQLAGAVSLSLQAGPIVGAFEIKELLS